MQKKGVEKIGTKEYLYQLRIFDTKINNKMEEMKNLKTLSYGVGGSSFGERVQTSKKNSNDDKIIKLLDFQVQLNKDIDEYVDLKAEITKKIDKLKNSEHIDILYKRYVHNKSWRDISIEMNYTERTIHRLHGKALKEFEDINKSCHTMS